jgi:hypothetical protein
MHFTTKTTAHSVFYISAFALGTFRAGSERLLDTFWTLDFWDIILEIASLSALLVQGCDLAT